MSDTTPTSRTKRRPLTALVTGGGGFLGRHIVARLLARGDRVRVYGRRRYPDLARLGVDCRRGAVQNPALLASACEGVDVVFHIAALADIWGPRRVFYETNVQGTLNVVSAAGAAGVGRLVYCSTPSVVYDGPIRDGDESLPYPTRHECPYAETKARAERIVLGASHEGLRTCALRPHLIWGPGDTHIVPALVERSRAGRLRRVGDGKNRVSVSYVENVADAHLAACDRLAENGPVAGQAYFINDDEPVNCWDFIDEILLALGEKTVRRSVPLPAAYALGAVLEAWGTLSRRRAPPMMTRFLARQLGTDHWFSNEKAKRELGWSPRVGHDQALCRMVEAFREGRARTFDGLPAAASSVIPAVSSFSAPQAAGAATPGEEPVAPMPADPGAEASGGGGGIIASLPAARGFGGYAGPSAEGLLAERGLASLSPSSPSRMPAMERILVRQRLYFKALLLFLAVLALGAAVLGAWLWGGKGVAAGGRENPPAVESP